ncbi:MAG: endolytic transglycosylase MltG [Eubacterium sp.]|nr:endolytic transglycosylase MltG [Eubacterium sp.]
MFDKVSHFLIKTLLFIFLLLLAVFLFRESEKTGYAVFADRPYDSSPAATESVITVREKEPLLDIAKDLERSGIVKNAYITAMAFRSMEGYDQIVPGEYIMKASMKPSEILKMLIHEEEEE